MMRLPLLLLRDMVQYLLTTATVVAAVSSVYTHHPNYITRRYKVKFMYPILNSIE